MTKYLINDEETSRLVFKPVNIADYDEWLPFFTSPETTRHWISNYDTPERECMKWYEKQSWRSANGMGSMNSLIEKSSGRLIGYCGLLKQVVDGNTELEIAYSLLPVFWNKGYATEAAEKCKQYAFSNNLSDSLISIISLTNVQSERVAKKIGMTLDKSTIYKENKVNIFRVNK